MLAVTRKRPAIKQGEGSKKKVHWHPSVLGGTDTPDSSNQLHNQTCIEQEACIEREATKQSLDSCTASLSPQLQTVLNTAGQLTKPFDQVFACMPYNRSAFIGKHSFVVALDKQQFNLISAFTRLHGNHPAETSGCLVVPDWSTAWFNPLLKGMQLLQQYPAGSLAAFPTN